MLVGVEHYVHTKGSVILWASFVIVFEEVLSNLFVCFSVSLQILLLFSVRWYPKS